MISFHSLGIVLSQIMEFVRSVIILSQISDEALNISVTTPEGPSALPFFILFIDFSAISRVTRVGGPNTGSPTDKSSSLQGSSTFTSLNAPFKLFSFLHHYKLAFQNRIE